MKVLHLTLKKKWFDMIASGEKKEEYRETKPYWVKRLHFDIWNTRPFDRIIFRNGYSKDAPRLTVEMKGMRIGKPKTGLCEPGDETKDVYILELGKIIDKPE